MQVVTSGGWGRELDLAEVKPKRWGYQEVV